MSQPIGFNKPYFTGRELDYIRDAVAREKLSGNGFYTQQCQKFFEDRYSFRKVLLTQSCTDALEMSALLLDIKPGDEVILPSFTFVSTANAFALRGANLVFADSSPNNPNLDPAEVSRLLTPRTKAVVVVHYAGVAVDLDPILQLAAAHNVAVVEDAAQAIDSFYKGKPLGAVGHLSCFSFHETKNIISGEGGMLVVSDPGLVARAEIIWEKGTNRSAFYRGEIDRYNWIDLGSSFLPSELTSAFLWAQLEELDQIQVKRKKVWDNYFQQLLPLAKQGCFTLSALPEYATNNAHLFYILMNSADSRDRALDYFKAHNVQAIFHYLPLHSSPFFRTRFQGPELVNANRYASQLIRLPLFTEMTTEQVERVVNVLSRFCHSP
ncbi:MAG: dTDP-4-amino-4,6-dideoxygalactose transaminase [Cyclobacteriaceae bacterium]|jgi:dTDP-4-amino-4,6-dideoxygalactose transaminase|nr:dTDP-4-amino-4,6-dideoxygalactose transaminase [Flammeovirgaceae bacterium]